MRMKCKQAIIPQHIVIAQNMNIYIYIYIYIYISAKYNKVLYILKQHVSKQLSSTKHTQFIFTSYVSPVVLHNISQITILCIYPLMFCV